jgi:hypothetical protein
VRKVEENTPTRLGPSGPSGEPAACRAERAGAGPGWAKIRRKILFEYTKALEICTRRFRRNFDIRIFLNSSRLLKYFRKMEYAMPSYATLGKIN